MRSFRSKYPWLARQVQNRFSTDKQLEEYVRSAGYGSEAGQEAVFVAVVFTQTDMGRAWAYAIRGNGSDTSIDTTMGTVNRLQTTYSGGPYRTLLLRGHLLMQDHVEQWIIEQETGVTLERSYAFQPFATPPYVDDGFADAVSAILGLFFTIIYMWPVTRLVKGIVEEKQLRIKEGMRMMGLPDSALFCSWLCTYTVIFFLTAIGITIVTSGSVYSNSNKFYIFIFFFFFALSTFAFCWLLSVFFSRSQVATTFAALAFLALFFPYFAVQSGSTSKAAKSLACLSAQICFGLGAVVIQKLESTSNGVSSSTASLSVDNWSYNATIGMFVADFFIYLFLALYFQQIVPSEWGTHQKWNFFLQPSFWCKVRADLVGAPATSKGRPVVSPKHRGARNGEGDSLAASLHPKFDGESEGNGSGVHMAHDKSFYMEPVAEAIKSNLGVSIRNLRKVFPTDGDAEDFVAVQDMNLDLYSGQILALLGHNGAGKTTTINMMTGMLAPTSGDAFVYGASITEDMASVRKILGVCPQHNILFDLLTVKEHLELYAAIKDVPAELAEVQITEMIAQVGLNEKVNDKSAALSGGMQRKLSVGIALLGDSKIVFLDEPTSGMDPYSRRATWDLLKKKKEGRVIILTTHFMDEADQLGDRIAIMAKGDVKCCGSSLFLKGKYGVGYTLTITKAINFNEATVTSMIQRAVSDSSPLSNIAAEISFRLPFQSSAFFADLFDAFDRSQGELGIAGYGISVTTLEEVFLRVGHEEDAAPEVVQAKQHMLKEAQRSLSFGAANPLATGGPDDEFGFQAETHEPELVIEEVHAAEEEQKADGNRKGGMKTIDVRSPIMASRIGGIQKEKVKGLSVRRHSSSNFSSLKIPGKDVSMTWRHFHALLWKRWLNAKRDRKVVCWTLLYPFLIILAGCGLVKYSNQATYPSLTVTPSELDGNGLNYIPTSTVAGAGLPASASYFANPSDYPLTTFAPLDPATFPPSNLTALTFNQHLLDQVYPTPRIAESHYNAFQGTLAPDAAAPTTKFVDKFVVYFNTSCSWATSLGLNAYNAQVLRALGKPDVSITATIHPMPLTANLQTLGTTMTAIIVAIGFAFMPASFIAFAVKEEQDKVKHQQLISGVSAASYWAANFAWDFCNYMVMGLLCLLIFQIWGIDALIGSNAGAVFLAILLYGLSVIPFTYMASFMFSESTSAQNSMLLFYIFVGALLLIVTIVMGIIPSTQSAAYNIKFFFRLAPSYCFGECIANILTRSSATFFGSSKSLMDIDIVGWPMLYMSVEIFVYGAFVLAYEKVRATPALRSMLFGNPDVAAANSVDTDADVIHERERLSHPAADGHEDCIKVSGLRKVYKGRLGGGNKIAVQDLWMGIPQGQCFGFLGINGAGKTTTLKMLTGDIIPGSGTATLNGLDILQQQNDVRRLLGYCPQFDALIDTLTAREHLVLFARIKGVPEDIMDEYVDHLLHRLGLQEGIADKPSKGYSGGNKRKLCVGIALIGNPPIVFLDEPSTGMDPGSRRFMWDLIASTMKNRSVILTTHSMEECEALCHRIGIMVGGRLRCLGSTTHLKDVYGDGYQLDVNVAAGEVQDSFKAELGAHWPDMKIIEQHGDALKFRLPRESQGQRTTIGQVFRLMELMKRKFDIQNYSVSETTLEQIFIHFAKQQEEETGHVAGLD